MKATHNGHCQVCGRLQAARPWKNAGIHQIAKHGYTVPNGWFQGTCHGSDEQPIERDVVIALDAIETFELNAVKLAATKPEDVTLVTISVYQRLPGQYVGSRVPRTFNQGEYALARWLDQRGVVGHSWEAQVAHHVARCWAHAKHLRSHVEFLRALIKDFYGKELSKR